MIKYISCKYSSQNMSYYYMICERNASALNVKKIKSHASMLASNMLSAAACHSTLSTSVYSGYPCYFTHFLCHLPFPIQFIGMPNRDSMYLRCCENVISYKTDWFINSARTERFEREQALYNLLSKYDSYKNISYPEIKQKQAFSCRKFCTVNDWAMNELALRHYAVLQLSASCIGCQKPKFYHIANKQSPNTCSWVIRL